MPRGADPRRVAGRASMKVPPKRKGNPTPPEWTANQAAGLNESPSEKEGKFAPPAPVPAGAIRASMKVPPKRKGNWGKNSACVCTPIRLNESPSEKEGKSGF